jgi:hypothetical protein
MDYKDFYAGDTFERNALCNYVTTASSSADSCYSVAKGLTDHAERGITFTNKIDTVTDNLAHLQAQVDKLIQSAKLDVKRHEAPIRAELKTLHYSREV